MYAPPLVCINRGDCISALIYLCISTLIYSDQEVLIRIGVSWLAPLVTFSILVGLNMDYDVFLITGACFKAED